MPAAAMIAVSVWDNLAYSKAVETLNMTVNSL